MFLVNIGINAMTLKLCQQSLIKPQKDIFHFNPEGFVTHKQEVHKGDSKKNEMVNR